MDDIIGGILEFIEHALNLSFDSSNRKERKRILLITALVGFTLFSLLIVIGIVDQSEDLILWSSTLLVALIIWLILKIRKYRKDH